MTKESLSEILAENYLGLGAIGRDVIKGAFEDYLEGRHNDWIEEIGVTETELLTELLDLCTSIVTNGYLDLLRMPDLINGDMVWSKPTEPAY